MRFAAGCFVAGKLSLDEVCTIVPHIMNAFDCQRACAAARSPCTHFTHVGSEGDAVCKICAGPYTKDKLVPHPGAYSGPPDCQNGTNHSSLSPSTGDFRRAGPRSPNGLQCGLSLSQHRGVVTDSTKFTSSTISSQAACQPSVSLVTAAFRVTR